MRDHDRLPLLPCTGQIGGQVVLDFRYAREAHASLLIVARTIATFPDALNRCGWGLGLRLLVQLAVLRAVTAHLHARVHRDPVVAERALDEEGDVALVATGVRVAAVGRQEACVERLLGRGARPGKNFGGNGTRLHVLAGARRVVVREAPLALLQGT